MAQEPTHILKIFKSQNSEMLFRADDGICIGQRKNETVIFGDEPNKRSSHVFINGAKAVAWLEEYAAEDLKKRGVSLDGGDRLPPKWVPWPLALSHVWRSTISAS